MLAPGAGEQPSPVYPGLLGTIKGGDLAGVTGQLPCPEQLWCKSLPQTRLLENMENKEIGLAEMLKPGWGNAGPFAICWMLPVLIKIFSQQ